MSKTTEKKFLDATGLARFWNNIKTKFATAAQGEKADSAVQSVAVGGTITGEAGTNASVTNSGTPTAPVLDFTIPRGADGTNGTNGTNGVDGKSAYQFWLEAGNTGTVTDFLNSLKADIGDFKFAEYDSAAFPNPAIGDTASSIVGIGSASVDYLHTIILMPNGATPTATMMIITEETSTKGVYQFVYAGELDVDMTEYAKKETVDEIFTLLPVDEKNLKNSVTTETGHWKVENDIAVFQSSSTSSHKAAKVEAPAGYSIVLTFTASTHTTALALKAVIITDADLNVLQTYDVQEGMNNQPQTFKFETPANTRYICINYYAATGKPTVFTATKQLNACSKESFDRLEKDVENLFEETSLNSNILDPDKIISGNKHINTTTGEIEDYVEDGVAKTSLLIGPIKVKEGVRYLCRTISGDNAIPIRGIYYFDAALGYISGWEIKNTATGYRNILLPPANAAYVYLRFYTTVDYEAFVKARTLKQYGCPNEAFIGNAVTLNDSIPTTDSLVSIQRLKGKTVAILGDSIGTREGYNDAELTIAQDDVDNSVELSGYVSYQDLYGDQNSSTLVDESERTFGGTLLTPQDIGTQITFVPLPADVGKKLGKPASHGNAEAPRWWQMLEWNLGVVGINASWSGASMTSGQGLKYRASYAWHDSIINRCGRRTPGTMDRIAPDYIFICRGINDMDTEHVGDRIYLTEGTFDNPSYNVPDSDTLTVNGETKYGFKEAYALTIMKLRVAYPSAKIICCTITNFRRGSNNTPIVASNGTYSLPQFNKAVREVAEFFGCPVCDFNQAYPYFPLSELMKYTSTASDQTHANEYGHRSMYEKALLCLAQNMKLG